MKSKLRLRAGRTEQVHLLTTAWAIAEDMKSSDTRLVLESKAEMRRRDVSSPDEWDAVALTFAEPVAPRAFRRQLEYPARGLAPRPGP